MEYAIEILKEKLQTLENAHNKFVINGSVKSDSLVARKNREQVLELQTALAKLEPDSSLSIDVVSGWVASSEPPKVDYFYLVYDENLCRICKALYDGDWHTSEDDVQVTHWMHLPKPPCR